MKSRSSIFIIICCSLHALCFANKVGSASAELVMNQFYMASMPIYATRDILSSGGWQEHHFCICNSSTQVGTYHRITWGWVNSSGNPVGNAGISTVGADGVERAGSSVEGAVGHISAASTVDLVKNSALESKSLASLSHVAGGSYADQDIKSSFWLNPVSQGIAPGKGNFAYVWYFLSQNNANVSISPHSVGAGSLEAVEKTFPPWPVSGVASSLNNLSMSLGLCNYRTIFSWASDAGQCGNHPFGSIIMHIPKSHYGGSYEMFFKISTEQDTDANGLIF